MCMRAPRAHLCVLISYKHQASDVSNQMLLIRCIWTLTICSYVQCASINSINPIHTKCSNIWTRMYAILVYSKKIFKSIVCKIWQTNVTCVWVFYMCWTAVHMHRERANMFVEKNETNIKSATRKSHIEIMLANGLHSLFDRWYEIKCSLSTDVDCVPCHFIQTKKKHHRAHWYELVWATRLFSFSLHLLHSIARKWWRWPSTTGNRRSSTLILVINRIAVFWALGEIIIRIYLKIC